MRRKCKPWMSESQIVNSYRNATNPRTHPYIMAEINECELDVILSVLTKRGFDVSDIRQPAYYNWG